ncbi:hypothetical protein [Marinobacter sp. CHS3-4]|uniref:hypothetical protein n=1 Tax=Marinobacter sp. CHS3-4 TaxID=3045174 RepID=UPI0024B6116B|nr:hypothetical protein [Marinobacter sp. CHS3-4]MDI9244309.1 hypothetical protein [Marinobacter sp. CHS3-4]
MNRKPDIIRTIAIIFVVGLVITGFTSMQTPDGGLSETVNAYVSEASPNDSARPN